MKDGAIIVLKRGYGNLDCFSSYLIVFIIIRIQINDTFCNFGGSAVLKHFSVGYSAAEKMTVEDANPELNHTNNSKVNYVKFIADFTGMN